MPIIKYYNDDGEEITLVAGLCSKFGVTRPEMAALLGISKGMVSKMIAGTEMTIRTKRQLYALDIMFESITEDEWVEHVELVSTTDESGFEVDADEPDYDDEV